ncbi:helix-turn-helix transcriptional regulator [Halalkalicoccus jeotgali]|uniref:DUF7343 domain-containing protein n=1 Tax=Halalkalicoccus jeotgali (strain DSM 18796 / CECT 7217 / JCM 14584 / KCTC 4019 / B3) TaxID=795797 RepID=D8J2H0_HALJB|nr:helix-turn-helix domain-containing protein [Halalkalicoccus jeotgali]ADJ14927.1 hypothetical protein HacjB3_07710 [Halalkalicoccus jeotgali B3]ELY35057.1 hypothetical protein C497_15012 [Halalkalicoccus jeotgali B3]
MYWVSSPFGGLSSVVGLQTPPTGTAALLVGLCVVLAASGAIAWRRRASTRTPEPEPETTTAIEDDPGPTDEPAALTDEERIHRLLESNQGRMRQRRIVEETDWSKSKVSTLLSSMESEGTITKLRIGRENLISHPGFEPDATRSPLESKT